MHRTLYPLSVLTVCLWAFPILAAPPSDAKPSRPAASEKAAPGREAQDQKRKAIANRVGREDSPLLATRMIQQFDKDGDEKLDSTELTALLTAMRDRLGNAPEMGRQRPGLRGEGQAREAGGDRPQRPESK